MNKKIGTVLIIALVVFFVYEGGSYLYKRSTNAISDAAFIKSDRMAVLAFNIGGNVIEMIKKENDPVKKGDLLARIDPIDLDTAKSELGSRIDSLDAEIAALTLQKERISPSLKLQTQNASSDLDTVRNEMLALTKEIEAASARSEKLSNDEHRYAKMLAERLISQSDFESIHTQSIAAKSETDALRAKLSALKSQQTKAQQGIDLSLINQKQTAEFDQKILSLNAQKNALMASLNDLDHKIGYTELYAPFDGVVVKKFMEAPTIAKQGAPVYALSDPRSLYAEVLLSEKELHGVLPGNTVTLEVEAVSDKTYHGTVESIASASASTFSLVPRDIASGEFTKLDQRFSIRIRLDNIDGLRAGMGTTVVIERK